MSRKLRILHFDMECLPGHWIGGDYVSKIITATATSWRDSDDVVVYTHYDHTPSEMASMLSYVIGQADIVTGHYIRGFDLPLLNGNLLRANKKPLGPVTTLDTKLDLVTVHGRSQSQENLSAMLGVEAEKLKVTLAEWEAFNQRAPEGKEIGIARVVDDVLQHKQLYEKLRELGWLGPPKVWQPTPSTTKRYHA